LTTQRSIYLASTGLGNAHPAGLARVDWRGRGGYVVAPPSRHVSGHAHQFLPSRDLDTPLAEVPAALRERLQHREIERPAAPVIALPLAEGPTHPYARAALAEELGRVATAPVGERNRRLWEAGRNLYNLVAGGALPERQVHQGLLAAAERCGLLGEEPRQTRRTLASARQVGLAHPRQPPSEPTPNAIRSPRRRHRPSGTAASRPARGGEADGRCRPSRRLNLVRGWARPPPSRARAHPTTRRKEFLDGQPTNPSRPARPAHHLVGSDRRRAGLRPAQPGLGVPADTTNPIGRRDLHQRERALALGPRVAVAAMRENDRDPVIWLAGQDYRAARAIQAARRQPTRRGPERLGPER
jgi:bifunctional DNA primase/polymerase-like protein